jgi:hypothetical protein
VKLACFAAFPGVAQFNDRDGRMVDRSRLNTMLLGRADKYDR